jgi:hypothetical protein
MISGTESYLLEYKDSTDKDSVRLIARLIKILIIASIQANQTNALIGAEIDLSR